MRKSNERDTTHYSLLWFGGKLIPEQHKKYVETWKKNFTEYKVMKWDESNFPIDQYDYAKEAMQAGKMAFVSDIARIHSLYEWGMYLDIDVEVIKYFTSLLKGKSAILGVEDEYKANGIGFLVFAPKHEICYEMLECYQNNSFSSQSASMSNTQILADLIKKKYNIELVDKVQVISDLTIYSSWYFTAYNGFTGKTEIMGETYCIHHFLASWHSPSRKFKDAIKKRLHRVMVLYH